MNEQEIEGGSDPLIGLGDRPVSAQCQELVQSPVSSILCHLGVHSEALVSLTPIYTTREDTYPVFSSDPVITPWR